MGQLAGRKALVVAGAAGIGRACTFFGLRYNEGKALWYREYQKPPTELYLNMKLRVQASAPVRARYEALCESERNSLRTKIEVNALRAKAARERKKCG